MANHATWQSELLKELRTQPVSADLNLLIQELEAGDDDYERVAAELNRINLNYFGAKTNERFYHERAGFVNKEAIGNLPFGEGEDAGKVQE